MRSTSKHAGPIGIAAWLCAAVCWVLPAASVLGQAPPDDPSDQQESEDPGERNWHPDRDGARRSAREMSEEAIDQLIRLRKEMKQKIELRDEQIGPVGDAFDTHMKNIRDWAEKRAESENSAQVQYLEDQLAEARRNRNRDEMRRIMGELREARGAGSIRALHVGFRSEVIRHLDQQQARQFDDLFRDVMMPRQNVRAVLREMRLLRRALGSVDLSEEQQEAVLLHEKELSNVMRTARTEGQEEAKRRFAEIREAILKELTPEQVQVFEQTERETKARLEQRRGEWRDRRPRPDRDAQPDEPQDSPEEQD